MSEALSDRDEKLSVKLEEKTLNNRRFCSFELFSGPTTTEQTYQQLFSELDLCHPLFYSITWHNLDKVSTGSHPSLRYFEKFSNIRLLHLAVRGLTQNEVTHVLNRALELGKSNIFALQGDTSDKLDEESNETEFPHAIDLVKFIRSNYGSEFSIFVAGYPEMHPRSPSKEADLFYLKAKVDAGADCIITQIVFESELFVNFVKDCRRVGIGVPIIPGIFLMPNFYSLLNVSKNCKANIPQWLLEDLEEIKNDDAAVEEYAIALTTKVVEEIFKSGAATGIHLFTSNRSKLALELCRRVGLCEAANVIKD